MTKISGDIPRSCLRVLAPLCAILSFSGVLSRSGFLAVVLAGLTGCAQNGNFSGMGAQLLSSTGLVSSGQAEAFLSAGSKLAKAATPLTEEQEYYLGRGVSAAILQQYPGLKDGEVNRYLNRVGGTLALYSDRPETFGGYHVLVLDTPQINAMSAPGGYIFLTRGFLKQLESEDQLAAVLAHEIGHVVKAHGVNAISNANLTEAVAIVGKQAVSDRGGAYTQEITAAFGNSIKDVVTTLTTKGFSRRQEYEADRYAVELLKRAGYNPRALDEVLALLERAKKSAPDGGWFATHPDPSDRIEEVAGELQGGAAPDQKAVAVRSARFRASLNRKA